MLKQTKYSYFHVDSINNHLCSYICMYAAIYLLQMTQTHLPSSSSSIVTVARPALMTLIGREF